MTLAQLADIAALVSGAAVAVSLVYLAVQMRQRARHQRGASAMAEHMQGLIQTAATSPELMDAVLRGWAGDPALGRIGYR